MPKKTVYLDPILLITASTVVLVMGMRGMFNQIMAFPFVFAGAVLVLGGLGLLRQRKVASRLRLGAVAVATVIALCGGFAQQRFVAARQAQNASAALTSLGNRPAPALVGLAPLNLDEAELAVVAAFSGRLTVVTFWATWCSPCRVELPELNELYAEYKDGGLNVIAVTKFDRPNDDDARVSEREAMESMVAELGLTFPAAIAPDAGLQRAYEVRSLPSTALIDAEGRLIAYGAGLAGGRDIIEQVRTLFSE